MYIHRAHAVDRSAYPGQTFRGTILGLVTDSSGAAVPGATVTIKNVDTGLTRTVTTTDDGSYSAPELPIGNYSVTVEKSGFKAGVVNGSAWKFPRKNARMSCCSRASWHKKSK
jgi:Cna protein B-type domain.